VALAGPSSSACPRSSSRSDPNWTERGGLRTAPFSLSSPF
jgi:hypothetical protein